MMIPILNEGNDLGTTTDMARRLRATLPTGWFPTSPPLPAASATPVLDGLLGGLGAAWSFCFGLLSTTVAQTRVSSASGVFLDMISADFFGSALPRMSEEGDDSFRGRISASLISRRGTRQDVMQAIAAITSAPSLICEPSRAADCGGYGGVALAGAGGGVGYGVIGLRYGSNAMPFQYLVDVPAYAAFAPGIICTRQSTATFLDKDGMMQLAEPYALRPEYQNGVCVGALLEGRGFNLIYDSRQWSGFMQSPAAAEASTSWSLENTAAGLFAADPVMAVVATNGTRVAGPSINLAVAGSVVAGSAWVYVPEGSGLTVVELIMTDINNPAQSVYAEADMAQVSRWQRLSISLQTQSAAGRNLLVGLLLSSPAGPNATLLTQCWQVEPGSGATSYIPTFGTLGIRAQDDVLDYTIGVASEVFATSSLFQAVASTIPAATIGWTSVVPTLVAS